MGVVCMNAFKKPDLIPFYTEALEFLYRPNRIFFFNFYCINYQKSQAEKSFLSFLAGQMALRGRSSSMGSNFSPPSLFVIACSWMWMGSHEPARMLWCRWFIHVVSSKSASRKTCECPLSHLRRWRGRSIDGKVSLIPDPCLLHVLEKDPEPKQPARLHYWCEKVQSFYLQSDQCVDTKAVNSNLYTGYKLAHLVTEATLCHLWLLFCRSRSRRGK